MKNKSDIHSVVFLGDYPLNERYAFLKRHKLKAIKRVDTTKNTYRYRIIDPSKFKSFSTKKIKTYSNDGHTRYVNLILGYY
tara:strand:- start:504 stop:746 length:243 start_codon:yes stop_codon:yes gene_type:complete